MPGCVRIGSSNGLLERVLSGVSSAFSASPLTSINGVNPRPGSIGAASCWVSNGTAPLKGTDDVGPCTVSSGATPLKGVGPSLSTKISTPCKDSAQPQTPWSTKKHKRLRPSSLQNSPIDDDREPPKPTSSLSSLHDTA
ncbi:hypothetical protein PIB30_019884 [Stylosanthes scabra]|uniref:Uncharacterized protein n=1 Tax=Stylosanthes scabra TaxID=79078 RepID=A0ABU6T847_9FABA|nr:hypothetical protein [Stylosanthes scabra]